MKKPIQKIKIHIWISLMTFLGLFLIRFVFAETTIKYGLNSITFGSVLFLLYGFYLIFISCLYFKNVFDFWKKNTHWEKEMVKSYALLLLFCVLITLLFLSGDHGPLEMFYDIISNPIDFFFDDIPGMFFFIGLSIVFPVSIYTGFLSIKSLILAKKEKKPYLFGIILLAVSLSLLIVSFFSFFLVSVFWIYGGIQL